jgi:ABC-type amino acid transport substrate-binding protein
MIFLACHIKRMSGLLLLGMIVILGFADRSAAEPASAQKSPGTTVVVLHCSYPPVSFLDTDTDRPAGFFVDLMDIIAVRAGLQVSYVCESGWPEMMSAIESGKADLGALMKSEEREKRLLFTAPIEMTYLSFFARSQSSVDAGSVPAGLRVGAIKGSMSYEQLKDRPGIHLRTEGSYKEGLFSLLAGEIDLFAGEESMILKSAREARLEDRIKKVGKPFVERERCIAVRKDDVLLLEQVNRVLPDVIRSPEYQRAYLKWYGTPEPFWTAE